MLAARGWGIGGIAEVWESQQLAWQLDLWERACTWEQHGLINEGELCKGAGGSFC